MASGPFSLGWYCLCWDSPLTLGLITLFSIAESNSIYRALACVDWYSLYTSPNIHYGYFLYSYAEHSDHEQNHLLYRKIIWLFEQPELHLLMVNNANANISV